MNALADMHVDCFRNGLRDDWPLERFGFSQRRQSNPGKPIAFDVKFAKTTSQCLCVRAAKLWKPKELKIHETFNPWNRNTTKMGDYRVNIALVRLEGGESVRTHPSLDDGRFSREGSTQTVKGYHAHFHV